MNIKQFIKSNLITRLFPTKAHLSEVKSYEGEVALPEVFEIEPTNTCNLRCIMCHASFIKHNKAKSFDLSLLQKLSSLRGKWAVVGSNFEPSMHPQFVDIVKTLSNIDCKIDLTTNGTLISKKVTDRLTDCNIKNVTISFDGIKKDTFEKIRRKARFESAVKRILYFRETLKEKDTFFATNSVLMRSNIDELIDMIDFWDSNDFHQLRFIFMVVRSLENDLLQESLYPIRKYAFAKLDEAAGYVINNNLKIMLSSPYFNWSKLKDSYADNVAENLVKSGNPDSRGYFNPRHHYQNGEYPGMQVNCRSPFTFARILFNGDVQLCYNYIVGNLNEQDFEDIWYSRKAQHVRQLVISSDKICHTCDFYRFCLNSNKIDTNDKKNYFQQNLIKESKRLNFDVPYP